MSSGGASSDPRRSYDVSNQSSNPSSNTARGESSYLLTSPHTDINMLPDGRGSYRQLLSNNTYAGDVELPPISAPAPILQMSGNNSNRRLYTANRPSSKHLAFVIISYIIAVFLGSLACITLRNSGNSTNLELNKLLNRLQNLDISISSQQMQNNLLFVDIQSQLSDQQITLKHLSNLSNAHVLYELQETRTDLYQKMSITQSNVQSDLQAVQLNVTEKIALSHSAVEELISQSQTNMTVVLNDTAREFNVIILKAGSVVKAVQVNVTHQLERNDEHLRSVVDITNNALIAAQRNLTANLARSRQELSDATADTNIAIVAAERNVTVKLAKSASEFKAAVATATNQLEIVQRNVSLSLAEMSGTLRSTSADLNAQVETAKITIHEEVQAVQDSIEQYVAFTDKKFASENDFVRYQLAGTFTLLGCLISLWHLTSHLRHYYKPDVQRRVMAVLWMVPIYSVTSWFSLVFPRYDAVFAAIRDCYEAYAVYTFIALLIAILVDGQGLPHLINKLAAHVVEERRALSEAIVKKTRRPAMHLRPPFPCCYTQHKPYTVAAAWLFQCQLMTMQFVMMKPLLTALPFILRLWVELDYDGRPPILNRVINPYSPKLYIQLAENISVAVAFYALLSFFHGTEKDLAWCDPWPKFLCIKGVVFMTFWQGFIIQVMGSLGMVNEKAALQIQNLLICIEMLIASLAHFYIFPYHEWQDGYKSVKEKTILLRDTLALRDFARDMKMMVTTWDVSPSPENPGVRNLSHTLDSPSPSGADEEEGKEVDLLKAMQIDVDMDVDVDESDDWILRSPTNFLRSDTMGNGVVAFPSLPFGDLESGVKLKAAPSSASSAQSHEAMKSSLHPVESTQIQESDSVKGLSSFHYTINPLYSSRNHSSDISASQTQNVNDIANTSVQNLSGTNTGSNSSQHSPSQSDPTTANSVGSFILDRGGRATWGDRDSPLHHHATSPLIVHSPLMPTLQSTRPPVSPTISHSIPSSKVSTERVMTGQTGEKALRNLTEKFVIDADSKIDIWSWSVPGKSGLNIPSVRTGPTISTLQQDIKINVSDDIRSHLLGAQREDKKMNQLSGEQENVSEEEDEDEGDEVISCSSLESSILPANTDSDSDPDPPFHDTPECVCDSHRTVKEVDTEGLVEGRETQSEVHRLHVTTSIRGVCDEVDEEDDMSSCLLSVSSLMERENLPHYSSSSSPSSSIPGATIRLSTTISSTEVKSSGSKNYSDGSSPHDIKIKLDDISADGGGNALNKFEKTLHGGQHREKIIAAPTAERFPVVAPCPSASQVVGHEIITTASHSTFLSLETGGSRQTALLKSKKKCDGGVRSNDDYVDKDDGDGDEEFASGGVSNQKVLDPAKKGVDSEVEGEEEDSIDSSSLFSTASEDAVLSTERALSAPVLSDASSSSSSSSHILPFNLRGIELLEEESV